MKISITASILILLVAALYGIPNYQRLTVVRQSHAKLVAEAAQLGISPDPSNPADPVRITKRRRGNKEAEAKLAAAEYIAFSKEREAIEKNGDPLDEARQKRMLEIMDRMMSLDSAQLKILITELRASKELKDESRQRLIGFSIMTLANNHPQAALSLLTESEDLFKDDGMGKHLVSSSLVKWAKDDPLAAFEWVKKNSEKFPDLFTDKAKRDLISSAAVSDPELAFKLIGRMEIKEIDSSIYDIIRVAKTPEERTATLAALREHLKTLPDEDIRDRSSNSAMRVFATQIAKEEYDTGSKWITQSNLTPAELDYFSRALCTSNQNGEKGQWIEWIGKNIPSENSEEQIHYFVRSWTENDFQAAGKWLATTPAGPTKNTSIRSYAETVSHYEPETAAQWALTLPPGQDRDETLQEIYDNWPKNDDAAKQAASAFAKEHGLK
jgi:hypothetical protein